MWAAVAYWVPAIWVCKSNLENILKNLVLNDNLEEMFRIGVTKLK